MFYPKNFPKNLETILVEFLGELENEFEKKDFRTKKDFEQLVRSTLTKKKFASKFNNKIPPIWWLNFILLRHREIFSNQFITQINRFLTKTQTRSISGIVPLALFLEEKNCPFRCIYCPNEPMMPKGYFSDEPAVMRAIRSKFKPLVQAENRLVMLSLSNHPISKVELILKGGTFSFYSKTYREEFVKQAFDACNSDVLSLLEKGQRKIKKSVDLRQAQKFNEKAKSRVVGFNIETRPDFINNEEVVFLRRLGVAHVELGVQVLDYPTLNLIKRGHGINEVKKATFLLKEAGFKVGYHLMPNLPGMTPEKDLELLKKSFDSDFSPDYLKIYPTMITKYSELSKWFDRGEYKPYSVDRLVEVIGQFKSQFIPPWVRIGRLTRDITVNMMTGAFVPSNLRQTIQADLKEKGLQCQCIRCREIRDREIKGEPILRVINYKASKGEEYFLEFVDNDDHSLGFLRLRIPAYLSGKYLVPFKVLEGAALIRELHVFGQALSLGGMNKISVQHRGLGTKLVQNAEEIVLSLGIKRIAIISGVGVRGYYRKFGYRLNQTYMVKNLG